MSAALQINPRAALLRDESGAIVGSTCGDTQCWRPVKSSSFASFNEDGDGITINCRESPGCLEHYRRYLARRLHEHFKAEEEELWELQIECGLSEQSNVCSRLNHSLIGPLLRGWCRVGADGVALIVSGKNPRQFAPRFVTKFACGWKRIRLSRGRRAFASITSGMVRARAEYGENLNRFYFRGVKPLPKEFTWSRPSGFGRGIKNRMPKAELAHTVRSVRDGVSIHLSDAALVASMTAPRRRRRVRRAGGITNIGDLLGRMISESPLIAPARSAGASSVTEFRNTPAMHGEGLSDDEGRAMRIAASPHHPQDADLNLIKGSGLSSSRHFPSGELGSWVSRMQEKARKRKPPD